MLTLPAKQPAETMADPTAAMFPATAPESGQEAALQHTAQIDWPNCSGHTPCTPEYRDAVEAEKALSAELRDMERAYKPGRRPESYPDLHERAGRAADRVMLLQATGHQGRPVNYGGPADLISNRPGA